MEQLEPAPHEDALRRDFTINGLFYDIERDEMEVKRLINRVSVDAAFAAIEAEYVLRLDADAQRDFYTMGQQIPNLMSMARGEFVKFVELAEYLTGIDYDQLTMKVARARHGSIVIVSPASAGT